MLELQGGLPLTALNLNLYVTSEQTLSGPSKSATGTSPVQSRPVSGGEITTLLQLDKRMNINSRELTKMGTALKAVQMFVLPIAKSTVHSTIVLN